MSKPESGHFKGTMGQRKSHKNIFNTPDKHDIIVPEGIDTRDHPTKYKQMSSKKQKELRAKKETRTITKEEYKRLEWQRRLNIRRKAGIDDFWEREQALIALNLPTTRNWSAEQRADILKGKRPKFKGVTIQSHHKYSVARYPHLANNGKLIYPATYSEHYNRWHGKNYKNSRPGKPVNPQYKEEF